MEPNKPTPQAPASAPTPEPAPAVPATPAPEPTVAPTAPIAPTPEPAPVAPMPETPAAAPAPQPAEPTPAPEPSVAPIAPATPVAPAPEPTVAEPAPSPTAPAPEPIAPEPTPAPEPTVAPTAPIAPTPEPAPAVPMPEAPVAPMPEAPVAPMPEAPVATPASTPLTEASIEIDTPFADPALVAPTTTTEGPDNARDIIGIAATEPAIKMPKSAFAEAADAAKAQKKPNKLPLILTIVLVVLIAAGVAAYFLFFNKPASSSNPPSQDTEEPAEEEPTEEPEDNSAYIQIQEWGIQLKYPPQYHSFAFVHTEDKPNIYGLVVGDYQVGVDLVKKTSSNQTVSGTTIATYELDSEVFVITTTTTDKLIQEGTIEKADEEEVKKIQDTLIEFYKNNTNDAVSTL